ncbi:unnamed protein product [Closterium sp. Yama58-4]|nr:unnamed protein product [Closterium sp. Yama58-4]
MGEHVLEARNLWTQGYWVWADAAIGVFFTLFCNAVTILALKYLNHAHEPHPHHKEYYASDSHAPHVPDALSGVGEVKQHGMVLPFTPLTPSFHNVNYFVDMPADQRLQLLRNVSGVFRPGEDQDICVSGYPKVQETFVRVSGYCEQEDIHTHTPQESCVLSIISSSPHPLLSPSIPIGVRGGGGGAGGAGGGEGVGTAGQDGLSVEQRKRLTIAVELVANPAIIFMDKPTSAAIVMSARCATVKTGRTSFPPSHAYLFPSPAHLFPSHDYLFPSPAHLFPSHDYLFPSPTQLFPSPAHLFPSHAYLFRSPAHLFPSHDYLFPSPAHLFPSHAYLFPSPAHLFPSHAYLFLPRLLTSFPPMLTSFPRLLTYFPPMITSFPRLLTSLPPMLTSFPRLRTSFPPMLTSFPRLRTSFPPMLTSFPCLRTSFPPMLTSFPRLLTSFPPMLTSFPRLLTSFTTFLPLSLTFVRLLASLSFPTICRVHRSVGLDARVAAIVMMVVHNTVKTGRTVVCTIHQPAIDIFEAIDKAWRHVGTCRMVVCTIH